MTLLLILLRSSVVKSPFHILFNIRPYSGSSLKRWSLSSIIIALMQLSQSQCLLEKLENKRSRSNDPIGSSWRKSPANMIVNPPKGLALFLISFSFTSSIPRFLSLMNDTSSTMRFHTSCHVFLSLRLNAFC